MKHNIAQTDTLRGRCEVCGNTARAVLIRVQQHSADATPRITTYEICQSKECAEFSRKHW